MRVAVTGATGFIGRHVVRQLVARGAEVVAISRNPDPALAHLATSLRMDIGGSCPRPLATMGFPDVLVHLAWGGLPNYRSNSHIFEELPRHITFLDECVNAGLPRIVVAGTCLEYGIQSGELEESIPALPTTAYGEAKRQLHAHLLGLQKTHEFSLGWLRFFYLYGNGQAATSLYQQLRAAVNSKADGFDMSPGDQIRDFLDIETAANYAAALSLDCSCTGIVNICSGRPVTVIDIVQRWLASWESDLSLRTGVYSYPDYEAFSFWGSTRNLNSILEKT